MENLFMLLFLLFFLQNEQQNPCIIVTWTFLRSTLCELIPLNHMSSSKCITILIFLLLHSKSTCKITTRLTTIYFTWGWTMLSQIFTLYFNTIRALALLERFHMTSCCPPAWRLLWQRQSIFIYASMFLHHCV